MKNSVSVVIVAVLIVANGVFAGLNVWAASTINSDQTKTNNLTAAFTAVQATVNQLTQTSGVVSQYGAIMNSINPAVVKINDTGPGLRGYASGVIVSANGYVLTVLHNVTGAKSITVTLSTGEQVAGTISATDTVNNLALIKLTSTRTDFPVASRGAFGSLLDGQVVITASYPDSVELPGPVTFTVGIVSSLRTSISDNYFIQTDADIAQGSGGGGMFSLSGKLVGIASLGIADGIYDFIPIDAAATLLSGAGIT